ncbi:hypothetical protein ACE6H2_003262 [Prunus campanulata]
MGGLGRSPFLCSLCNIHKHLGGMFFPILPFPKLPTATSIPPSSLLLFSSLSLSLCMISQANKKKVAWFVVGCLNLLSSEKTSEKGKGSRLRKSLEWAGLAKKDGFLSLFFSNTTIPKTS